MIAWASIMSAELPPVTPTRKAPPRRGGGSDEPEPVAPEPHEASAPAAARLPAAASSPLRVTAMRPPCVRPSGTTPISPPPGGNRRSAGLWQAGRARIGVAPHSSGKRRLRSVSPARWDRSRPSRLPHVALGVNHHRLWVSGGNGERAAIPSRPGLGAGRVRPARRPRPVPLDRGVPLPGGVARRDRPRARGGDVEPASVQAVHVPPPQVSAARVSPTGNRETPTAHLSRARPAGYRPRGPSRAFIHPPPDLALGIMKAAACPASPTQTCARCAAALPPPLHDEGRRRRVAPRRRRPSGLDHPRLRKPEGHRQRTPARPPAQWGETPNRAGAQFVRSSPVRRLISSRARSTIDDSSELISALAGGSCSGSERASSAVIVRLTRPESSISPTFAASM